MSSVKHANLVPDNGDDAERGVGDEHGDDDESDCPGRLRLLDEGHREAAENVSLFHFRLTFPDMFLLFLTCHPPCSYLS